MIRDLVFVALALLAVVPAVWVVSSRNIVHAGFALLFTLLGVAGLYAFLGADFLAVTQFQQLRVITRDPDVLQPNSKRGSEDPDILGERQIHELIQRALAGSKKSNVPLRIRSTTDR